MEKCKIKQEITRKTKKEEEEEEEEWRSDVYTFYEH